MFYHHYLSLTLFIIPSSQHDTGSFWKTVCRRGLKYVWHAIFSPHLLLENACFGAYTLFIHLAPGDFIDFQSKARASAVIMPLLLYFSQLIIIFKSQFELRWHFWKPIANLFVAKFQKSLIRKSLNKWQSLIVSASHWPSRPKMDCLSCSPWKLAVLKIEHFCHWRYIQSLNTDALWSCSKSALFQIKYFDKFWCCSWSERDSDFKDK